jgi:hypothetical protein
MYPDVAEITPFSSEKNGFNTPKTPSAQCDGFFFHIA